MSDSDDPTSQRQRKEIDCIADEFERAFRQGLRPSIEFYLEKHPDLRPNLFNELIALEVELRRSSSEQPTSQEYISRFLQYRDVVESIFAEDVDMLARTKAVSESMSSRTLRSEHAHAKPEAPMPTKIGRYEIQSVVGSGGFGTVFRAYDSQLNRCVAVKVPNSHRKAQRDFTEAFLAEARKLARLDHPHIVPVYDFGGTLEYPCYIVSKYIDGQNLAQQLPALDWSWEQRANLVATIAEALHCSHMAGLVHRDVKPANVLLDQSKSAFLADFGLALSDEDYDLSLSESLVGTLNYMSPEQVCGESHLVDGRADVFSLGILMYELLTGVRPFSAPTREQISRNIVKRDAKALRLQAPSVPRELERICLRALEKRKSLRYVEMAVEKKASLAAEKSAS